MLLFGEAIFPTATIVAAAAASAAAASAAAAAAAASPRAAYVFGFHEFFLPGVSGLSSFGKVYFGLLVCRVVP